jgi:hypothetical protein
MREDTDILIQKLNQKVGTLLNKNQDELKRIIDFTCSELN